LRLQDEGNRLFKEAVQATADREAAAAESGKAAKKPNKLWNQYNKPVGLWGKPVELYVRALSVFVFFSRAKEEVQFATPEEAGLEGLTAPESSQVGDLVCSVFVNVAACLLKTNTFMEAKYACEKALERRPENVKALYRKSQAHIGLETSTDLDIAVDLLKRCLVLEPRNAEVKAALRLHGQERSAQMKKDAGTFGKMFERGDLIGDDEVEEVQARQVEKQRQLNQFSGEERQAAQASKRNPPRHHAPPLFCSPL